MAQKALDGLPKAKHSPRIPTLRIAASILAVILGSNTAIAGTVCFIGLVHTDQQTGALSVPLIEQALEDETCRGANTVFIEGLFPNQTFDPANINPAFQPALNRLRELNFSIRGGEHWGHFGATLQMQQRIAEGDTSTSTMNTIHWAIDGRTKTALSLANDESDRTRTPVFVLMGAGHGNDGEVRNALSHLLGMKLKTFHPNHPLGTATLPYGNGYFPVPEAFNEIDSWRDYPSQENYAYQRARIIELLNF